MGLMGDTCETCMGYCSAMIQAVLRIGFEEMELHRMALGVYSTNHCTINFICEKLPRR
jgi:RimJ/RimL family protein N-acetyltransferase